MRRILPVLALAVLLATSACGGEDKPKADPTPSASASESATPSPSPTPTPTPSPTVPAQSPGKYGVTYTWQNWDRFGNDAVLRDYDVFIEALSGSLNRRKLAPEVTQLLSGELRAQFVNLYEDSVKQRLHVPRRGIARVLNIRHSGASKATMTFCGWRPSQEFTNEDGVVVEQGGHQEVWERLKDTFTKSGNRWQLSKITVAGKCQLPRPR